VSDDKALTVDETASLLNTPRETVPKYLERGQLVRFKHNDGAVVSWRIGQSELDKFVAAVEKPD
jgi:excisionase family DNA binding protein